MRGVRAIVVGLSWMLCTTASAVDVVDNAVELGKLLNANRKAVVLEPITALPGCGPNGCLARLDTVTVLKDRKALQGSDGRAIRLIQHAPGDPRELPTMNWDPLQAFDVIRAGVTWGVCIEFTHAGVGNSGSLQRWRTVVLVPRVERRSIPVAHRFTGYWAGCDLLSEGDGAGEVVLPLIEPIAVRKPDLHLVRQRCDASHCESAVDGRAVRRDVGSGSGALVFD